MRLTNNNNLHEGLFFAIEKWFFENYDPDREYFRVTDLIKPVQLVVLERRHHADMEVDAMDLINAWRGTAAHEYLSRYDKVNVLQEIELELCMAGETVRGHPDYYHEGDLVDMKNCKVWSYIHDSNKWEWTAQLNMYAFMLRHHGFPVKSLSILAVFDDWKPSEARRGGDYPRHRSVVIPIEMWEDKETVRYMETRLQIIRTHLDRETMPLPQCTPEERWEKKTVYAVMKEGRKSAVKLHETEDAMLKHIEELGAKHYPEIRPGERVRCQDWCSAAPFCAQWQTYLKEQGGEDSGE